MSSAYAYNHTVTKSSNLGDWRGVPSASRVFAAAGYEISDDLQRKKVEVLEKRYGGRARAHWAAAIIQKSYREYRLNRRWQQMTTNNGRTSAGTDTYPHSHTLTRTTRLPPESHTVNNNRYLPTTTLSAQLKSSDRIRSGTTNGTLRCGEKTSGVSAISVGLVRSPPSPAPNSNRSMIDSLMSPRLVHRSFPVHHMNNHQQPGSLDDNNLGWGVPTVWVPRAKLSEHNPSHSTSLSRLEKQHHYRQEPETSSRSATRFCSEQERKRQYRIALNFFNKKPERGVQLLTSWGFVEDSAESLAKLLFGRRGLSKSMIGEYIGTLHSPFHSCVLKYFVGMIDLRNLEIDVALRKAFQFFILPKEAEKIDRILQAFALHYVKCNPARTAQFRGGWDTVHLLAFAIIMLNTDLHSPTLKASQRMRREDFVKNLRGQDKLPGEKNGSDLDRLILEGIFERVRVDEFRPGDDHVAQVARVDLAIIGKDKPRLTETQRRLVCYCRLQQVMDPHKRSSQGTHERDVFLFNDMLVVTKAMNRRKSSAQTYSLKGHTPLQGATVQEFDTSCVEFGLVVRSATGEKLLFNARNAEDRRRFVADVQESIRESCQMEEVRLEVEMDKHNLRSESQRDSGLPEMEGEPGGRRDGSAQRRLSFNSLDSGVVEESFEGSN